MVKIVKKKELPPVRQTVQRIASVLIALVCSALFIALLGFNPVTVYVPLFPEVFLRRMRLNPQGSKRETV